MPSKIIQWDFDTLRPSHKGLSVNAGSPSAFLLLI